MIHIRKACTALWGLLVLAATFAAAPAFAGDCAQWDVSGRWVLIQTNDTAVSLTLEPSANGYSYLEERGRLFQAWYSPSSVWNTLDTVEAEGAEPQRNMNAGLLAADRVRDGHRVIPAASRPA